MDKPISRQSWQRTRRNPTRLSRSALVSLALAIGSLCAGCIPLKYTTSPGATGKVVDATTHSPISGAEVEISRSTYPPESADKAFANAREPLVMSETGGGFSIPAERRLDLYCLPVDVFPRFGLLVVRCKGYQTTCLPFWSRSVADLGVVEMHPGQPKNEPGASSKR